MKTKSLIRAIEAIGAVPKKLEKFYSATNGSKRLTWVDQDGEVVACFSCNAEFQVNSFDDTNLSNTHRTIKTAIAALKEGKPC
jgi:hypothetical protein